jgi:hypothetical protein
MGSKIVSTDRLGSLLHTLWRAGIRGDVHQHYFEALTDIAVAFGVNVDALPEPPMPKWRIELTKQLPWKALDVIRRDDQTQS